VVASWSEHEAQNFGLETTLDYDTRYARSAEFVDVVKGLWDGWDDGALLLDKAGGRYFDERKMHVLNHHGRFFKVRGPLSVTCMPQGHPVIVQAGASDQGRELGAATADVIYAINGSFDAARAYYADVKGRMAKYGREPEELKIMPAFCPVVGGTRAAAQAKFDELQELVDPLAGLGSLYPAFGDLSGYPLDGPIPDDAIGKLEIRSISAQLRERVRQEKPTIRELYLRSGITGSAKIGTPDDIADAMQEWFENGACDGFNITPAHLPGGCEDFVELVVPELQRRGLFRTGYEGRTLRENLGLKRPVSRYAAAGLAANEAGCT
jgi:FMN-dependent oxidoreductase (nitrilotriacetate monooxygenase family)